MDGRSSTLHDTVAQQSPQFPWRRTTFNNDITKTRIIRRRDGVALLTCILLLRLAFTPPDNVSSSHNRGGLFQLAETSITASIELAFYYPFQSHPPNLPTDGSERTARPVPIDIDGDGVVDAMVVPVFLKRDDVSDERQMVVQQKSKRSFVAKNLEENPWKDEFIQQWSEHGTWGFRLLNLKPLHHHQEADGQRNGPFAPQTMFLSPLLPYSTKKTMEQVTTRAYQNSDNVNVYPIKIISMHIPIQRTHLGEEEKFRQRHRKLEVSTGKYGTGSGPPPKEDPHHKDYDRTRHYFCGRDWHHASQSCHKHCPGGISSECGEGQTCYADTPCDVMLSSDRETSPDANISDELTEMVLTPRGTLPGISTVWSDGSVTLHVITADVSISPGGEETSSHHESPGKRARQRQRKPELDLIQLWRVFPFDFDKSNISNGNIVQFEELGLTFEPGEIYGYSKTSTKVEDKKQIISHARIGNHGAILLGGRYIMTSANENQQPLKASFHALDVLTGELLWESHGKNDRSLNGTLSESKNNINNAFLATIIHTTSSARRRSHLPTYDTMDPNLNNENAFIEGDDVTMSEECMAHFRSSVLDEQNGALPHVFWDQEYGSMNVGRFDRKKKPVSNRSRLLAKKSQLSGQKGSELFGAYSFDRSVSHGSLGLGSSRQIINTKEGISNERGAPYRGKSWQSDLFHRAIPRRLMNRQKYYDIHPQMGRPNVVLFHGRDGLAVISLKNGHPVCHISLLDHALYADIDKDGIIDVVQVVTSPTDVSQSTGIQSLIQRIASSYPNQGYSNNEYDGKDKHQNPVICHALVSSGLPPREEVFSAPICLGGSAMSMNPKASQPPLVAAPPLLVEGSLGYGNDIVFAMNNGVVVRYDSNGREVWRKKYAKDGTPSWVSSKAAYLGRIQFGAVKSHSSISASSHRNQHRPGSPFRPILLSGEDGAALISPSSGKVLSSVFYPQIVLSTPLLTDLNGDGTDDLSIVSADAIWGYRIMVETERSGFFSIMVVTLVVGVALACLAHKTSHTSRRSVDL